MVVLRLILLTQSHLVFSYNFLQDYQKILGAQLPQTNGSSKTPQEQGIPYEDDVTLQDPPVRREDFLTLMQGLSLGAIYSSRTGSGDLYRNKLNINPVVDTEHGKVQGFVTKTYSGKFYSAHIGIPFARAPIGDLRFADPKPALPWRYVMNTTKDAPPCMNYMNTQIGKEDCLYINVFVPRTRSAIQDVQEKATMVYIYGGAFIAGSSLTSIYAPDFFVERDVALVTFNYRTGPMGFLSLQNDDVPGNAGLKDQSLALKWVRNNIRYFGGDPGRVTIFGESAGAASVHYHQLSPISKGLFDRAIQQSGTSMSPWAYTPPDLALNKAFNLGNLVGCNAMFFWWKNKKNLLTCLRRAPAEQIVSLQEMSLTMSEADSLRPFAFIPTSEPNYKEAFMPASPREMFMKGLTNYVPIITGTNSRETIFILPELKAIDPSGGMITVMGMDLTRLLPPDLNVRSSSPYSQKIVKLMRSFYFQDRPINPSSRADIVEETTDVQFLLCDQEIVMDHAQKSQHPVYNYRFTYDGPFNWFKVQSKSQYISGAAHADELGYQFNPLELQSAYRTKSEEHNTARRTVDRIMTMWTNFAKTGSPTPTDELNVKWREFTRSDHGYLEIGKRLQMKRHMQYSRIQFWNNIYDYVQRRRPFPEVGNVPDGESNN